MERFPVLTIEDTSDREVYASSIDELHPFITN